MICVALAVGLPASIRATTLILSNGDRLTGRVIKRADGKVYFHSDLLGDIVAPENIVRLVESPSQTTPSLHGSAPMTQPAARVAVPLVASTTATAAPESHPPHPAATPVVQTRRPRWTGKVEFGYANQESTVRTVNVTLHAEIERTVGADNFLLKDSYGYSISAGQPNTEMDDASLRWRHSVSGRMFLQSLTSYDSDKIRLVRNREEENVGVGYKVIGSSRQTVDVGAGVSGLYLDAVGVQPGFGYLGNVFQDYSWKINEHLSLTEDTSVQFSPETPGHYVYALAANTPLYPSKQDRVFNLHTVLQDKITNRLSLNLRLEYGYESAIPNPSARGDERITSTLGFAL